jgi:ADP-ribosylglycohydrolase
MPLLARETTGPLMTITITGSVAQPPISSGRPTRTTSVGVIFDALAHPAQAAAVAAAASNQSPRGRKRKTASMVALTLMCAAVVYYSGTLYEVDVDEYFAQDGTKVVQSRGRRTRLRSRTRLGDTADQGPSLSGTHHQSSGQQQRILRDRIVNTIKAAFLADAASMGTHWIYDTHDLNSLLLSRTKPEFRNPPLPKFYSSHEFPGHYGPGQASPYGEQLLFVTQYAASLAKDALQLPLLSSPEDDDGNSQSMDPASISESMSIAMQEWLQSFGGRADHAALQFLSCRQERLQDEEAAAHESKHDDHAAVAPRTLVAGTSCGADDDQAHFFLKVIPLTCMYVGHAHRRRFVEQAIRVHQNNDLAVLFGLTLSDLLERVLLMDDVSNNNNKSTNTGSSSDSTTLASLMMNDEHYQSATSLREALDMSLAEIQDAHTDGWFHFAESFTELHQQQELLLESWQKARDAAENQQSSEEVAGKFGRSCHMPGALVVSLHALYRAAFAEPSSTKATTVTPLEKKEMTTSLFSRKQYEYYINWLLGTFQTNAITSRAAAIDNHGTPGAENNLYMIAVRENILAAGDTCSRAILMGAILGAAYGPPPLAWWQTLYPVLSGQVEEAAYEIADFAVRRMSRRR